MTITLTCAINKTLGKNIMFIHHNTKTIAGKIIIGFFIINFLSAAFGMEEAALSDQLPTTEEQLSNLEEYMLDEDDSNHELAVEEAGEIVISALKEDNVSTAWRAFHIVKQGWTKSQDTREQVVHTMGDIVLEVNHEEISYEASFSLEQTFYLEKSEEVVIQIIKTAETIVRKTEDKETAQKFILLIIQALDQESDRIQRRALRALAKIASRLDTEDIALQALSEIENSKSIRSEEVAETIVSYVVRQLVHADNETIVNRGLDLLEWGMTQSEYIQIRTIKRAGWIIERTTGVAQDRAFGILQKGFSANEKVRSNTIETAVETLDDIDEDDVATKNKLLNLLKAERINLDT